MDQVEAIRVTNVFFNGLRLQYDSYKKAIDDYKEYAGSAMSAGTAGTTVRVSGGAASDTADITATLEGLHRSAVAEAKEYFTRFSLANMVITQIAAEELRIILQACYLQGHSIRYVREWVYPQYSYRKLRGLDLQACAEFGQTLDRITQV